MKKDLTLLIMAAGAGSRFGGLKQIEPFGPNGEFIIDYSIYDAIKAGFTKVVFVIKKENYEIFKDTIGKRVEDKIIVEYAFQELDVLPNNIKANEERVKPFGTGQAILCAKSLINEPFGVINADDFYGYDSFLKLADFLQKNKEDGHFASVCFKTIDTMSKTGAVKRGIIFSENKLLNNIIECSIEKNGNKTIASPLDGKESFEIDNNTLCSVNMFGFTPSLFPYLETKFIDFLNKYGNSLTEEFLIPKVIDNGIKEQFCKVNILSSKSIWLGITYKEDVPEAKAKIKELINLKEYNEKLWD